MEIPKFNQSNVNHDLSLNSQAATAASVLLDLKKKKKKIKINRKTVNQVAQGMAEIAFSLGNTSDIDSYVKDMSDDVYSAFQNVKKRKPK